MAAAIKLESTVSTSTLQETKPSWNVRGAEAVRRVERARWKRARAEERRCWREGEGRVRASSALASRVSATSQQQRVARHPSCRVARVVAATAWCPYLQVEVEVRWRCGGVEVGWRWRWGGGVGGVEVEVGWRWRWR